MLPQSKDDFDIISHKSSTAIYSDWEKHVSSPIADTDVQIHAYLREHYPELTVTVIPTGTLSLLTFANAGYATAELDTKTDRVLRWRGYVPPTHRGGQGHLGDAVFFAKYHYKWQQEDFILYTIGSGYSQIQYLLKEPGPDEDTLSHCAKADALIKTAIGILGGNQNEFVYVFDGYWFQSRELWDEVMKSSWDNVILDPKMKQSLQDISSTFFDSEDLYDRYGVPWKRGLIFAGPPGNGKTISIKALMKTLYNREEPVPTLYVKSASSTAAIGAVFRQARTMTPCLLVMEDIETIVNSSTRSYFFNEVDGLNNNGGLLMVASTNYLERLDPGLSKRPSRFDRKFIFPLPDEDERTLYAEFWRNKLQKTKFELPFPLKLCRAMAQITDKFSFAYLQEAFVATLLTLARDASSLQDSEVFEDCPTPEAKREGDDGGDNGGDDDDLDSYKLWRTFKNEVAALRENMGESQSSMQQAYSLPPAFPFHQQDLGRHPGRYRGQPHPHEDEHDDTEQQTHPLDPNFAQPMPLRQGGNGVQSDLFFPAMPDDSSSSNGMPRAMPADPLMTAMPMRFRRCRPQRSAPSSTLHSSASVWKNNSKGDDEDKAPGSLELAARGVTKRQYVNQSAMEWKK